MYMYNALQYMVSNQMKKIRQYTKGYKSNALLYFSFFTAIAEALNCKICVKSDKKMVLDCLDDATLSTRVSTKWQDSGLHVLPMMKLNYKVSYFG